MVGTICTETLNFQGQAGQTTTPSSPAVSEAAWENRNNREVTSS